MNFLTSVWDFVWDCAWEIWCMVLDNTDMVLVVLFSFSMLSVWMAGFVAINIIMIPLLAVYTGYKVILLYAVWFFAIQGYTHYLFEAFKGIVKFVKNKLG